MDSDILNEIKKEFEYLNNAKEITNLKCIRQIDKDYDILDVTFDKDGKQHSIICDYNYIIHKLIITVLINIKTNEKICLSYSEQILNHVLSNIKTIFKQIFILIK